MTTHTHSSRSRSIPASELQHWLVSFQSTLTAGLLGLTKSLLSSGFFPAFSGRWRGEPSDFEEAEGGGGEKVSLFILKVILAKTANPKVYVFECLCSSLTKIVFT